MNSRVDAHLSGQVDACVFDAYGTVFDVGSAVGRFRDALGNKVGPLTTLWRAKQTAYAWLRSLMGEYTDFWHITGNSLDSAMGGARNPGRESAVPADGSLAESRRLSRRASCPVGDSRMRA